MFELENIQVELLRRNNFRIITDKGEYLQSNSKIIAFIDNSGKRNIIKDYYTLNNVTIIALSEFFNLSKSELLKEYKNGSITTLK